MATAPMPSGEPTGGDDVCVIPLFVFHSRDTVIEEHACNIVDVICKAQNLHCFQLKQ